MSFDQIYLVTLLQTNQKIEINIIERIKNLILVNLIFAITLKKNNVNIPIKNPKIGALESLRYSDGIKQTRGIKKSFDFLKKNKSKTKIDMILKIPFVFLNSINF